MDNNPPGDAHFSDLLKVHALKLGDEDMFVIPTAINAKETITKLNLGGAASTSGAMD